MIPVESISSGAVGNLMYYVSIISVLLFVATIIRLKVSFLRKAVIPASLIAGLIGLALSPNFLNVIPKDIITSMSRLPTHLIVPVFACMFLGRKKHSGGAMAKDVTASVLWTWAASFMQFAIPCLLVALVFGPMMGISHQFGAIFECGFAGGHGTASAMASMFTEQPGWADGADLAMTTATIGLLSGIFGGVILINFAVRKKWTRELTEPASAAQVQEIFKEGERKPTSYGTINSDVIEPFAFHLAVIGIAILLGRAIVYLLGKVVPAARDIDIARGIQHIHNFRKIFPVFLIGQCGLDGIHVLTQSLIHKIVMVVNNICGILLFRKPVINNQIRGESGKLLFKFRKLTVPKALAKGDHRIMTDTDLFRKGRNGFKVDLLIILQHIGGHPLLRGRIILLFLSDIVQ